MKFTEAVSSALAFSSIRWSAVPSNGRITGLTLNNPQNANPNVNAARPAPSSPSVHTPVPVSKIKSIPPGPPSRERESKVPESANKLPEKIGRPPNADQYDPTSSRSLAIQEESHPPPVEQPAPKLERPVRNVEVPSGGSFGAQSGGENIVDTVNRFRGTVGAPPLSWNQQLAEEAASAGHYHIDVRGLSATDVPVHPPDMGAITRGQVMIGGVDADTECKQYRSKLNLTPFGAAFYGWACEVPSAIPENCREILDTTGTMVATTGHFNILSDAKYSEVGCSYVADPKHQGDCSATRTGMWACNVR